MPKRITQKTLVEIGAATVPTTGAYGDVSAAVASITWKGPQNISAHEGGMGQIGVAGLTTDQGAATVQLTATSDNGALKILKAYLQGVAPASFVAWNAAAQKPVYLWGNERDAVSGKKYRSFFVCGAMFDGDGAQIGGNNGGRQLSGQALWALEFEKAIQVDRIAGNATPVTALTPTKTTMIAWPSTTGNRYALAVLKLGADGSVTLLDPALGDYTETATAITLAVGLGATEAALIFYLYTDA
jgi:hypothetical protein